MIKAKNILKFLILAGIFISGILPAMSQDIPNEEFNDNTFRTDILNSDFSSDLFADNKNNINIPQTPPESDIASIRFTWNNPVSIASFTRNGKIWIVFDHQNKFDIETMKLEAGDKVKEIYSLYHPSGVIVVVEPADGVKHAIRKEGLLWILDLYTKKPPVFKLNAYTFFNQYDSLKNSYIFIPTPTAGNVMSFIDPEIGDIITVSTTSQLGRGVEKPYRYPDFDILPSNIGIAFILNSSDIVLNRGNSGITLKAIGRGLNISQNLSALKRDQFSDSTIQSPKNAFDFQMPNEYAKLSFNEAIEKIKNKILSAPHDQKNTLRIQMSKYFIYNGLGTNALFILNQIKKLNIPEIKDDHFYALSGVANFLARRYDEAIEDFSNGNLPNTDEGVFWRTIAKSAKEHSEEYNALIFAHVSLMRDYPQPIKDKISIIAAKNAIETGDDLTSQNFIDILKASPERLKDLDAQITYLNAKKLEMQGYMRNAINQYKKLTEIDSAMFSAYGRLRYTVIGEILKFINLKEAITELEKLRFAWGEKAFKIQVLNQLAKLYLKNNDYYNALRVLNEQRYFLNEEQEKNTINRMVKIFEDIFIGNHADSTLSPIKALALFQDFKWLAPLSKKHYQIMQKLADRLVAIDLLQRAQELLLSMLYKTDVPLEDQAKVGARLAIIYLFENKPHDAFTAIEATDYPSIPETLKNQRNIIASRALSDIGRTDEALALIKNDFSPQALIRKFEIYWNAQDWDKASDTIKYLIEEPVEGQPLSTEQINYILDWATTLKQAGKETVLVRLRNKFAPFFKGTAHQSAFNVLTDHLEEEKIDISSIKTIISDIKDFNTFARFYTEQLEHERETPKEQKPKNSDK